jgi:predicted amidophosphoribosyltransferase
MEDDETQAIVISYDNGVGSCRCSKCTKAIYWQDAYCRYCGRKVVNVDFHFRRSIHDSSQE